MIQIYKRSNSATTFQIWTNINQVIKFDVQGETYVNGAPPSILTITLVSTHLCRPIFSSPFEQAHLTVAEYKGWSHTYTQILKNPRLF